jgi:hypothetical protein
MVAVADLQVIQIKVVTGRAQLVIVLVVAGVIPFLQKGNSTLILMPAQTVGLAFFGVYYEAIQQR